MPTEDFSNFERRYRNALDRLEASSDIHDRDRDAIQAFIRDRDGSLAPSSLSQYVNRLRTLSERSDVSLVDLDIDDVHSLFFDLRNDPDAGRGGQPSDSTVHNYQAALAAFGNHRGDDWVDDFSADKPDRQHRVVDETDMLTQDDIAALTDACNRPRNQAMVEFLADTGSRLSMMGSLRIKDVDLDGERATYRPNPEAIGLKDADIKPYPIIDSKASLRVYLRHSHPRPNEPEAALFHKFKQYGPIENDDGALTPSRVRTQLEEIGNRAGVNKPVNPHNFRHSAITRMWREGYDKSKIQHRVQWTLDTDMWQRYVHVTAEEMNEQIFAEAGVVEDHDALSKERTTCGNCRETIAPHASWCPNCGEPATPDAREQHQETVASVADGQAAVGDLSRRQLRAEVIRLAQEKPDLFHSESPSDSKSD